MKRKSLFLFALIVALLSLTNVHVSAEPVLVNLEVGFIDPTNDQDEPQRNPVIVPSIEIEDNILTFITSCDYMELRLVNEENEVEYKYLKSIIEGGIEPKPDNVSVYATSNRRHLIKETFKDNGTIDDDLNRNETQAEKLSLAYRFGLQIYYSNLSPMEFKKMVKALAIVNNINIDDETLYMEANRWQLRYGSLSGRCATQFVSYLINKVVK